MQRSVMYCAAGDSKNAVAALKLVGELTDDLHGSSKR